MRLIDADALLARMKKAMESGRNLNGTFHLYIEHAPTMQRQTGEWIDTEFLKLKECSCCHNRWGVYSIEEFDFCPSCGARMKPYKGGDDE